MDLTVVVGVVVDEARADNSCGVDQPIGRRRIDVWSDQHDPAVFHRESARYPGVLVPSTTVPLAISKS